MTEVTPQSPLLQRDETQLPQPFLSLSSFHKIQPKCPLAEHEVISYCPIACYLGEENDLHPTMTSFQVPIEDNKDTLFFRPNNPSSLSCYS